jgi:hypothetical protein
LVKRYALKNEKWKYNAAFDIEKMVSQNDRKRSLKLDLIGVGRLAYEMLTAS